MATGDVLEGSTLIAYSADGDAPFPITLAALTPLPIPSVGSRISRRLLPLLPAACWLSGARPWQARGCIALSAVGSAVVRVHMLAITSNGTARRRPTLTQPRVTSLPGAPGAPCHTRIEHEDEDGTTSVAQIRKIKHVHVIK